MTARDYYSFFYRTLRQCEFPGMKERCFEPLREKAPQIAAAAEQSFEERNS